MVWITSRELLPDAFPVSSVLAEEEVEGERGLRPELHQAELLDAAAHLDAVQVVAPGQAWGHALQRGRPHDGGVPLGLAEVGEAVHADRPVGTGELCRPLHGVVAVLVLPDERDELPLRAVTPAHVLHDDDVAGLRGLYRVEDRRARREVLAIREACEEDRIPTAVQLAGRRWTSGSCRRASLRARHSGSVPPVFGPKRPSFHSRTQTPPESTRTPDQDLSYGATHLY